MMLDTLSHKHFSILRVAKAQVGLSDEDYRALLRRLSGQESAKGLTVATFKRVMTHFEAMGFRSTAARKDAQRKPGKASEAQMRKISQLWADFTDGTGTDTSLRHWMERRGYGASIAWLEADVARKMIGALTSMVARKAERGARQGCA